MLAVPLTSAAQSTPPTRNPDLLARKGAAALEHQRFGDALAVLTEASTMLPRDPSVCFGAGIAAFMLGQNDAARSWFERALALEPTYVAPAQWLGELHYRAGRLREAIAVYETALQRSPNAKKLAQRLFEWRKESDLENRFSETRGPHFTVLFERPADEPIARHVVEQLEAAYTHVVEALDAYPPQPITAVLYTTEQFRDITRLAEWTAAGYDGRIRVPLDSAIEGRAHLDGLLIHEVVHALVATLGGRTVPTWVNEGLATALEPGGVEDAETTLSQTDVRPDLSRLHRSFVGLSASEAEVAYAYSTRAVQRLIELRGAPALVALLKDLGRGAQFSNAFQQHFGMRYEDFAALVARD
jgi:tetratricopeptide (TPR) repeat protein